MFAIQDISVRLDWVSFTVVRPDEYHETDYLQFVFDALGNVLKTTEWDDFGRGLEFWKVQKHHKPYSVAFTHWNLEGLVVMYSLKRGEMLVELQGRFCEKFPSWAKRIAHAYTDDCTRLDVAVDVVTDTRPSETGFSLDNKTVSINFSQSGETVYIGSPKSEKMMRVYRYAEPHPRAGLLRSEVVFRRGWAKKLAGALKHSTGMAQFVADYWRTQKASWWTELVAPVILAEKTVDVVSAPIRRGSDKTTASTLNWLSSQVRPAIARAIRDGGSLDEVLDALGLYWSSETTISVK